MDNVCQFKSDSLITKLFQSVQQQYGIDSLSSSNRLKEGDGRVCPSFRFPSIFN